MNGHRAVPLTIEYAPCRVWLVPISGSCIMQETVVKGGVGFDDEAVTALVDICHEFGTLMYDPTFMVDDSEDAIRTYMKSAATQIARRAIEYLYHHEFDYEDAKHELRVPQSES